MTVESLKPISKEELLEAVKVGINLQGNDYQNDTVMFWIDNVKEDLKFAGVSEDVVNSTLAVGCIARGVDDYWASHREMYSEFFYAQAERLRSVEVAK